MSAALGIALQAKALAKSASGGALPSAISAIFDGDSKAAEPKAALRWVHATTPLDVFLSAEIGVGGSNSGNSTNNLTNPARMAGMVATVAADIAAGFRPDIWLTVGTNDFSASAPPETVVANVRKYHNAARAAGARYLVLMSVDPRVSGTNRLVALNRAYADYAALVPDAIFCDTTPYLLDPAATNVTHAPVGGASGFAFAPMSDGLHCNAYGNYVKRLAVAPVAAALYRRKPLHLLSRADFFDATVAPRGDLIGVNWDVGNSGATTGLGRMTAIGGASQLVNSGTGSVTGSPPLGWTAQGTLTGDLSVTFSAVNCPALDTYTGLSGAKAVRMAFSGTPTSSGSLSLYRYTLNPDLGPRPMLLSTLYSANALSGCFGLSAQAMNASPGILMGLGSTAPSLAGDQLPQLDGLLAMDGRITSLHTGNSGAQLYLYWRAGVPLSGSLDLISASWRPAGPLPPPSA